MKICNITVFLVYLCYQASADLFSALSDMEVLYRTQQNVMEALQRYVNKEKAKISTVEKKLSRFKIENEKAIADRAHYMENPMNAISLIKRLQVDLHFIHTVTQNKTEYKRHSTSTYPSMEDLSGAAKALARLQSTYQLNIRQLANGKLIGNFSSDQLKYMDNFTAPTASDSYEIARVLFKAKDFEKGLPWMLIALEKFKNNNEKYDHEYREVEIVDQIIAAYEKLGDNKTALLWTKRLIELKLIEDLSAAEHLDVVSRYERLLASEEERKRSLKNSNGSEKQNLTVLPGFSIKLKQNVSVLTLFEAYCRNGFLNKNKRRGRWLSCRFLKETHPYLHLARIKLEQLYLKPDIILMYDVISEEEMKFLKYRAKHRLQRPRICHPNGTIIPCENYIAKVSQIEESESSIVIRLNRRIEQFTGLNLESAQPLQVVNYGIGGYHQLQDDQDLVYDIPEEIIDYCTKPKITPKRAATVVFFMTNVEQGGATVFPFLGLTVYPVKGAALYWTNTLSSGDRDYSTMHGECPVLRGSKWETKKWILETGQEFRRPCSAERDVPKIRYPFAIVTECPNS